MAFAIGVAGQAQMGKDTLSDYLAEKLNAQLGTVDMFQQGGQWLRTAFADNVKGVYQDTFSRDRAFIEEWKVKPDPPPGFTMTVRKSLQFIGDGFRQIKPTIWLDLVFDHMTCPIIISDVRYVNEFLRVKQEGGLNILVGRTKKLNVDPNGSESQIRPYVKWCLDNFDGLDVVKLGEYDLDGAPQHMQKFDLFVKNDRTIEDLYADIDENVIPFVENFVFDFTKPVDAEILE